MPDDRLPLASLSDFAQPEQLPFASMFGLDPTQYRIVVPPTAADKTSDLLKALLPSFMQEPSDEERQAARAAQNKQLAQTGYAPFLPWEHGGNPLAGAVELGAMLPFGAMGAGAKAAGAGLLKGALVPGIKAAMEDELAQSGRVAGKMAGPTLPERRVGDIGPSDLNVKTNVSIHAPTDAGRPTPQNIADSGVRASEAESPIPSYRERELAAGKSAFELGRKVSEARDNWNWRDSPTGDFHHDWSLGRVKGLTTKDFEKLVAWEDNPLMNGFYRSGFDGYEMPALTQGKRYGAASTEGISRNLAEGRNELGVSMAQVDHPSAADYEWFNIGGHGETRPIKEYEGWLLPHRGSDNEPLMVGLREATMQKQSK